MNMRSNKLFSAPRYFALITLIFSVTFLLVSSVWGQTDIPIVPAPPDPNIIGIADNATACGGAVLCSTNGTIGYNGTNAFDLSTINTWFQIGTAAQPMTAGNFRVTNDTGAAVTSFSLTLMTNFNVSTPSVTFCSGSSGPLCDNFQIHGGAANYFSNGGFSGPDLVSCGGSACSGSGNALSGVGSGNFTSGSVTYNWSAGTDAGIPIGATFDINFASWNTPVSMTPEPTSMLLFGTGLFAIGGILRRRMSQSLSAIS